MKTNYWLPSGDKVVPGWIKLQRNCHRGETIPTNLVMAIPNCFLNFNEINMNENDSVSKLRPPPPLIRMNKSPPPLCPIPIAPKTMKQPSINFASDHRPFNTFWPLNPDTISQQPSTIQTISTTHNPANQIISSRYHLL